MPKRDKKTITIGSGFPYIMPYTDEVPTVEDICKEENLLGYIQGGCALEYSEDTHVEKDDMGRVQKIVAIDEELLVKLGLLTWNGNTLAMLIDRCKVTEAAGKRITKIGGAGNSQGKYYALCIHHPDPVDGDLWLLIVGRNTAGATLTFATDAGTKLEPEFKALPQDEDGTLAQLIEEIPAAS